MKFFLPYPRSLVYDLRNPLILGPQACPYLPDLVEYKRVLRLGTRKISPDLLESLNQNGFRRTQNTAWKPECGVCRQCVSVRIVLPRYEPSHSHKRVMRLNHNLTLQLVNNRIAPEHFRLFQTYQAVRHPMGDMSEMSLEELASMIEQSPVNSQLAEWRDQEGRLWAACLIDVATKSISLVYSFYEPHHPKRGLGNYIILSLVDWAKSAGYEFVYLGFWVKNSPKMNYKIRFRPLEFLSQLGWREIDDGLSKDFAIDLE